MLEARTLLFFTATCFPLNLCRAAGPAERSHLPSRSLIRASRSNCGEVFALNRCLPQATLAHTRLPAVRLYAPAASRSLRNPSSSLRRFSQSLSCRSLNTWFNTCAVLVLIWVHLSRVFTSSLEFIIISQLSAKRSARSVSVWMPSISIPNSSLLFPQGVTSRKPKRSQEECSTPRNVSLQRDADT